MAIEPQDPDAELDSSWVTQITQMSRVEASRLEMELKSYKHNLIKESIRVRLELEAR